MSDYARVSSMVEECVSVRNGAKMLGVDPSTLKRMCDRNEIEHRRLPSGQRRIPLRVIEQWLKTEGGGGS